MKKFVSLVLVFCLLLSLGITAFAAELTTKQAELYYREIKILLDGRELIPQDVNGNSTEPFIIEGTTYLPVRAVAGALGLGVAWDNASSTISLSTGGKVYYGSGESLGTKRVVSATVGYRGISILLDGKLLSLKDAAGKTVEPFLMGGTTYVPVRAIADALGLEVDWNAAMNTVILSTGKCWLPLEIIRSTVSNVSGESSAETLKYSYNEDGSPAAVKYSSPERSYTASFGYDKAGRVVKLSVYGSGISWGYERKYDAKSGLLTYEKTWDGSDYSIFSYAYDDEGLLLAESRSIRRDGVLSVTALNYEYDESGRLSKKTSVSGDVSSVTTYTYNSRGLLLEETNLHGGHTMKSTYSYDELGNVLKIVYTDCGKEYGSHVYEYDDSGLPVSERYVYYDYSSRAAYGYDGSGRLISESFSDSEGEDRSITLEYDAYGNVCFRSLSEMRGDELYTQEQTWVYNSAGDLLSGSRQDSNGSSYSYFGSYDALGRCLYSESTVGHNTTTFTADYEGSLWPLEEIISDPNSFTVTQVEYEVFENARWLPLLEELHALLEARFN